MPARETSPVTNAVFNLDIHRGETVADMRAMHRHGEVEVNYLEAGETTYLIGGSLQRVPARRICFFWASVPHRIVDRSTDARGLWYLTIPLPWILAWELPPAVLGRLFDGQLLVDRKERTGDIASLSDWHHALHCDARYEKLALLEIEARFRRFALDNPLSRVSVTAPAGHVHLQIERMARFIVENFQKPLRLADIAAAASLHPNYAATLFRRHCGQTLLQCLNQHRIAHAQRLLLTTAIKVTDIASESGFGSMSRFYEAFVDVCSETPSAYRKRFSSQGD